MIDASFRHQICLIAGIEAATAFAAYIWAGPACAASTGIGGAAALIAFIAISARRRREIRTLADEIDSVLHSGRAVDFSSCREGDVAILRNEIGKVVVRLDRANQQAVREREALGDALADVSHQIRTPLTAIGIMIPLIERANAAERTEKLHELENMVNRVSWLVTSLLKMARLDSGAFAMNRDPVNAASMVKRAVAPLEMALDLSGIACTVDVPEDAAYLGDTLWSAEALENIVKNCIEHTPEGGSISIRVRSDAVACRIRVTDTGPGIAESDLPRIFDRFYRRSENEQVRTPQGFGVGLSLAHSIIGAQGGTVRASNAQGGGARFDIAFPLITTL